MREVVVIVVVDQHPRHADEPYQHERPQDLRPVPAAPLEGDDEREQVQRERREPEQRHRGDVLREVVGHREQQHRTGGREREPQRRSARRAPAARLSCDSATRPRGVRHATSAHSSANAPNSHDHRRTCSPRGEKRLDHERVADQREQRSEVRDGEQPIGVRAGPGAREPRLQQRAGGGDQKVGQPDRCAEQQQDAADRLVVARAASTPRPARSAASPPRRRAARYAPARCSRLCGSFFSRKCA